IVIAVDGQPVNDPDELVRAYGADATRYLLLTQYPFGIDGDIQMKRFGVQYNADLANDLGNLVSRVMKMIMTSLGGKIPKPVDSLDGVQELLEQAEELPEKAYAHMKHFRIGRAIDMALGLVRSTNKFFNDNAPWQLAKTDQLEKMGGILYVCCELIRIVSIVLFPVMPNKMREIRAVLSLDDTTLTLDNARQFFQLEPGRPVNLKSSVFPRIHKAPKVDENKGSSGTEKAVDESGLLDIKEFGRIDLRIARVEQAERVEGANKLLKLQINIGSEKRQIVAGIAETFAPEEIVGKTIVVVANLKPATIRGVKSQGMLLAAKANGELQLLTVDGDIPAGTDVG
ncbi:MAG: methionine--tRNA ligase subunit beta, partial [Candidatus Zixiibacteriota bacterium]